MHGVRLAGLVISGVIAAGMACGGAATANDSVAHLAAGGLVLSRTNDIQMRSEDLYISEETVRVRYEFHNVTDHDVTTLVAFPMPELRAPSDVDNFVIPVTGRTNFLGFETRVEDATVRVEIDQRARAMGIDRTDVLKRLGVPLEPHLDTTEAALARLPAADQETLQTLGMLAFDEYDAGNGMERHPRALWTVSTTYYWEQVFPAGATIKIDHRYAPSVGGSAQTFVGADFATDEMMDSYRRRYCVDAAFEQAARRAAKRMKDGAVLTESTIEYILATGSNWAGPIGRFRLVVDKGAASNLVSFCGENVRKISPTRFEMTRSDYWPEGSLNILILKPAGGGQ